jgi:hypothetical protein
MRTQISQALTPSSDLCPTVSSSLARCAVLLCLLLGCTANLTAQDSSTEFWPQLNAYFKVGPHYQVLATMTEHVATDSKDTDFRVGSMFLFHVPAIFRGRELRHHFEESRFLSLGAGYLYITPGPGGTGAVEQRGILSVTARAPLPKKFLLADRNQADLRWTGGSFYWRYRNQLTLQRNLSIHSYSFTPFARGELEYYSKYSTWYRTIYGAGVRLPMGKIVELRPYYQHENTSEGKPAHINAVGILVDLYFRE